MRSVDREVGLTLSDIERSVASLGDFRRLNHRMHNKLLIADGTMVVAVTDEEAHSMSVSMKVLDLVEAANSEVVISSPYFIPGERGVALFRELGLRKVKTTILTNSLASNDEPLVHTVF